MELTNDSRPSETSYQLIDALNDISFWLPRNAASSSAAIDPEGCYYFQITDMGDDGTEDFTLTLENKEWPVFENGEKTDGKSFLSRAVATIGTGCGLVESVPTQQRCENNPNRFDICLDYSPSMPFSTYQLFEAARMRWSEIITSDIDDVQLTKLSFSSTGFPLVPNSNGALTVEQFLPLFCDFVNPTTGELEIPDFAEPIDDLRICVASVPVDGPGGILGGQFNVINRINADGSLGLPLYSTLIVDLDGSDQVQAREDLFLYDNILHEMGKSSLKCLLFSICFLTFSNCLSFQILFFQVTPWGLVPCGGPSVSPKQATVETTWVSMYLGNLRKVQVALRGK
jgi:hypothetical protein